MQQNIIDKPVPLNSCVLVFFFICSQLDSWRYRLRTVTLKMFTVFHAGIRVKSSTSESLFLMGLFCCKYVVLIGQMILELIV